VFETREDVASKFQNNPQASFIQPARN